MLRLTQKMLDAGNAPYEAQTHGRLAGKIRAFRPEPVANLSDAQLVYVVARSHKAAKAFGLRDPQVMEHWVKMEALLPPGFFALPEVRSHFAQAFGDPDTKARDLFPQVKIDFRNHGRGAEIWW